MNIHQEHRALHKSLKTLPKLWKPKRRKQTEVYEITRTLHTKQQAKSFPLFFSSTFYECRINPPCHNGNRQWRGTMLSTNVKKTRSRTSTKKARVWWQRKGSTCTKDSISRKIKAQNTKNHSFFMDLGLWIRKWNELTNETMTPWILEKFFYYSPNYSIFLL